MKKPDNLTSVRDNQIRGRFRFSRREFIKTSAGSAALLFAGLPKWSLASNPTGKKLHGLSAFGDLKYPADYTHFEYAALDAPKGGKFSFAPSNWAFNQNVQTFNTLNSFILKGEAPPRMEACYDFLMGASLDEPDSIYCTLSKSVEISEDRNTYTFELRPEARFHDGSPVTAHDVAFSYDLLKEKGHPQIAVDLRNMVSATALADDVFELRLNGKQSDRAILSLATIIPIFSKAFYEKLPFEEHVMELPMGSGEYKVGNLNPGLFIEYDKVENYWAKDLPFSRGFSHFDTLRIDFFRERQAGFEAFKKGDIKWRQEFTSKTWATEYNFPAVKEGKVVQLEIPGEKVPSLQGWAVNTRKGKFADPRTRQAIGMVFDFKWTNEKLFYGAYQRSNSLFEESNFAANGKPTAGELALLEPYRNELPKVVFEDAVRQFESNGSGNDSRALRGAVKLLREAGWKREGNSYVDANGNRLEIEFLIRSQVFERILGPYVENLRKIGIPAEIRLVDPSQYQARLESFDFDICGIALSFGATPTKESLRQIFHSDSAARNGSRNYPGIALPSVDALIDRLDEVNSREELETGIKAIDRVLRAYHFWIPNWFAPNHRVAAWNMFGWKEPKPDYGFSPESTWWIDPEKAAALEN